MPVLPVVSPMTRAFGVDVPVSASAAAHQGEKSLSVAAHDRLLLRGKQSAAGEGERAAAVDDDREVAESLSGDVSRKSRRSEVEDLTDGTVAHRRMGARSKRAAFAPPGGVAPIFQLAGSKKSLLLPAGCHSKAPATGALSTVIVACPDLEAESWMVTWILSVEEPWVR